MERAEGLRVLGLEEGATEYEQLRLVAVTPRDGGGGAAEGAEGGGGGVAGGFVGVG